MNQSQQSRPGQGLLGSAPFSYTRVSFRSHLEYSSKTCKECIACKAGLQPGQPVALLAHNGPHFLEALLAVTAVGGIAAPLNWRWSAAEASAALCTLRPFALLADALCAVAFDLHQLASCVDSSRCFLIGSGHASASEWQRAEDQLISMDEGVSELATSPDGTAIVCFTSGTTGGAKGVCLSHAALHFQVHVYVDSLFLHFIFVFKHLRVRALKTPYFMYHHIRSAHTMTFREAQVGCLERDYDKMPNALQALTKVDVVGYSRSDIYLHIAPMCHIGGLVSALAMLLVGATHAFPSDPQSSPADTIRVINELGVTALIAVPAMIADLAAQNPQQVLP